jgi:dTDP-glucose 4,6-dehydratase
MKNVMITGGAGFIGSNLVRYMDLHHEDCMFYIVDKLTYAADINNISRYIDNINCFFFDYDITDKIAVVFARNEETDAAITAYSDYISRQVLASSLTIAEVLDGEIETLDLDGVNVNVSISIRNK